MTTIQALPLHHSSDTGRQWRMIGFAFLAIVTLLGICWFLFTGRDQAVLASDLQPTEAAAIVNELKKQDIAFSVKDGGSTILVPASDVDMLRVELSGADLPVKGTVGFELFNKSDMGLTDFAQKVNYQRALQGELARTIMAMDGIASARVHLALPERSLFRASRSEPRAAVTIATRPNVVLDADRVAGIQRLVAAAIPDLSLDQIAVLDSRGEQVAGSASVSDPTNMQYASALERAYAKRVDEALSAVLPKLRFDLKVTAVEQMVASQSPEGSSAQSAGRNHSIRIVVFTAETLAEGDQAIARQAISEALLLSRTKGDDVFFSQIPQTEPSLAIMPHNLEAAVDPAILETKPTAVLDRFFWSALGGLVATLIFLGGFWRVRRTRIVQHEKLVRRVRDQLPLIEVRSSAAA